MGTYTICDPGPCRPEATSHRYTGITAVLRMEGRQCVIHLQRACLRRSYHLMAVASSLGMAWNRVCRSHFQPGPDDADGNGTGATEPAGVGVDP